MKGYEFIDNKGTFKLEDPDLYSYLYFPVGAASGMMGSLTPEFGGDLKTSQNTFILEPVSGRYARLRNRCFRIFPCEKIYFRQRQGNPLRRSSLAES